jgi:Arc/MetJ family transcription regulator
MPNVRRTSLNLDFELVDRAKKALGTSGTTETVHRALEEVWRRNALERLAQRRFEIDDIEEFRRQAWEHEEYP